ncbi:condensation domain-containing protein, partial [Lysinibacillus fusiformis]|uniref:condensation domain-containing protein n=1 Tax=Lysinibacillus fusiformis TaxID=28031 RepID=UPI0038202EE5
FEIWGALLNGLQVHIEDQEVFFDTERLKKYIAEHKITIMWLTAGLFNQLCEIDATIFKDLRFLLIGGDVVSAKYVQKVQQCGGRVQLVNGYGPTENTTFSTYYHFPKITNPELASPIGKPLQNSSVYLLDEYQKMVPIGAIGEICVGGDGVSKGYLNAPELTAEKFIVNPFGEGRLYRTGDLGKYDLEGNVHFIGRKDNQVKIRGFRIELSEIEIALQSDDAVADAVVSVYVDTKSARRELCAYVIGESIQIAELRTRLKKRLPDYMIPSSYHILDFFPLNENGKVNREILPNPNEGRKIQQDYVAPQTELEKKMAAIWCELLGIEKVSIYDQFLELGGDSLKIISLQAHIRKALQVEVDIVQLFENMDFLDMTLLVEHTNVVVAIEGVKKIEIASGDLFDLSVAQKRIYAASQLSSSFNYNMPGSLLFEGNLSLTKLQQAIETVLQRHLIFRVGFVYQDGNLKQKIYEQTLVRMYFNNYQNQEDEVIETINKKLMSSFVRTFDLEKPELLHLELVTIRSDLHLLMFDMHHIISDGTTIQRFIYEVVTLYNGQHLEEMSYTYLDFVGWEQQFFKTDGFAMRKKYWIDKFSIEEISFLNMPEDINKEEIRHTGKELHFDIDNKSYQALQEMTLELSITKNFLMLSVFSILLHKYTNKHDLLVGTVVSGRIMEEFDPIFGAFINTLPLKIPLTDKMTIIEVINVVKKTSLEAFRNQEYPIDWLIQELHLPRRKNKHPLLDVVFAYQNVQQQQLTFGDVQTSVLPYHSGYAKFDIMLTIEENRNGMLHAFFEYKDELFSKEMLTLMSQHYLSILNQVVVNRNLLVEDIILTDFSASESEKILDSDFDFCF